MWILFIFAEHIKCNDNHFASPSLLVCNCSFASTLPRKFVFGKHVEVIELQRSLLLPLLGTATLETRIRIRGTDMFVLEIYSKDIYFIIRSTFWILLSRHNDALVVYCVFFPNLIWYCLKYAHIYTCISICIFKKKIIKCVQSCTCL